MLSKVKKRLSWFLINARYVFRPAKPLLIFRIALNFLSILFLRKQPLRYVDLAIGFRCNLACKHCFATALVENGRHTMTPAEWSVIAHQAMRLGAVNFSFQGGEPLIYPELEAFIKGACPSLNLISVTTNGTLLTDEMLEKLKQWGVDVLTVSLDSGIPEEHDDFRGRPGSFLEIVQGIERALKAGLNVTIGTVVTPANLHSEGLQKLTELSRRLKVILMLIPGIPIGRWKDSPEVLLSPGDIDYLNGLVLRNTYVRTDFYANYFRHGCGAVKEILYLNPYADVFACPFIHQKLGNALSEPFASIRARALENTYFKDYYRTCIAMLKEFRYE